MGEESIRLWGMRLLVIASEAKKSREQKAGLLRRCAPRNDGKTFKTLQNSQHLMHVDYDAVGMTRC